MEIADFAKGSHWAIMPNAFDALIQAVNSFLARGVDMKEIRTAFSVFESDEKSPAECYEMIQGVAVISVSGTITDGWSFLSFLFGGSSVQDIKAQFNAAMDDPAVKGIVFKIKSPGGTIPGVDALSSEIFAARGRKPMVAFAAKMASAAYWFGSAVDVVVAESTAILGSIGILNEHTDCSKADEMQGIKRTYIASGKFKAIGNDAEPLGTEARNMIQGMSDYLYSVFVEAVARNRSVSAETVLSNMADGRDFIGQQAVDAGLADVVGTMDTAVELALIMVEDNRQ